MVDKGIHYFTDVVGGAAVGTGVVLLIALILDLLAQFLAHGHQGRPGLRGPWRCVLLPAALLAKAPNHFQISGRLPLPRELGLDPLPAGLT